MAWPPSQHAPLCLNPVPEHLQANLVSHIHPAALVNGFEHTLLRRRAHFGWRTSLIDGLTVVVKLGGWLAW